MSAGLLLVMMEPPASLEEEFNDWYDTEHLPQRLTLPGFLSATRWACVDGWPRWMALYDMTSLQDVESPEYRAVSGSNPTPWSRRLLPRTVGRTRVLANALPTNDTLQTDPRRVSRLLLARYPLVGGPGNAAEHLALLSEHLAPFDAIQTRGFVSSDENDASLWVTAAFGRPTTSDNLVTAAGRCGSSGATLFNTYLPYRRA